MDDSLQHKNTTVASVLCDIVGYEAMERICDMFGGEDIKIPKRPPKELRHDLIRREFYALYDGNRTKTYRELATRYGMSDEAVRKIVQTS
jgi:Mor family transcriptional regulator